MRQGRGRRGRLLRADGGTGGGRGTLGEDLEALPQRVAALLSGELVRAVVDAELAALPTIDGAEWAWRKAIHDGFIKDFFW